MATGINNVQKSNNQEEEIKSRDIPNVGEETAMSESIPKEKTGISSGYASFYTEKAISEDSFVRDDSSFKNRDKDQSSLGTETVSAEEDADVYKATIKEKTLTSGYASNSNENTIIEDGTVTESVKTTDLKEVSNLNHKEKILRSYRYLKDQLDDEDLRVRFYQGQFFSGNDLEELKAEKVRHKRIDLFLRKILRLRSDAYPKFLQYLGECGYGRISKHLEKTESKKFIQYSQNNKEGLKILKRSKAKFLEELEPDCIADYFLQYEAFTVDEYEDVIVKDTRRKRAEVIYKLIVESENKIAYDVLITALKETGTAVDLLEILTTERNITCHTSKPEEDTRHTRLEQRRVKEWDTKDMTSALKDSKECQLHISLKSREEIENLDIKIVQEALRYDVMVSINDNLIQANECVISSISNGSIIITLKGCKKDSFQKLFATNIQDPVLNILRCLFLNTNIRGLFHRKAIVLEVELRYIPPKKEEKTFDVVETHFDFLVEELDVFQFIEPLKQQNVLMDDNIIEIVEKTQDSRTARVTAMLKHIQMQMKQDIFLAILKEKKKYVWDHICESENLEKRPEFPVDILVDSYEALAENMNPSLFAKTMFKEREIPMDFQLLNRNIKAKFILQHSMVMGKEKRSKFLHTLFMMDQIPSTLWKHEVDPKISLVIEGSSIQYSIKGAAKKVKKTKKKRRAVIFAADFVVKETPKIKADVKNTLSSQRHSNKRDISLQWKFNITDKMRPIKLETDIFSQDDDKSLINRKKQECYKAMYKNDITLL